MGAVRIAILAVAAAAAIALAFIVRGMMAPDKSESIVAAAPMAPPPKPMARVLVAKKDLAVGYRIASIDLGWQDWPVESLNPTFVTDGGKPKVAAPEGVKKVANQATEAAQDLMSGDEPMKAFDGAIVKETILAGEPLTPRKVVRGGEGGYMAVVLSPGMRAVSIPVTSETGVGGFILPGDRVDILQSRSQEAGRGYLTDVLMQNVKVLAIDQRTSPDEDAKTIVGGVATVEIAASDVEVLARGRAQGEMMLALRPYSDIGGPSRRGGMGANQTVRIVRAGDVNEVAVR
jgi:pilus assembly protein CpaB